MRICIVTSNVRKGDGQARVNYEIVQAALQRGHQITLLLRNTAPEFTDHPAVQCVVFSPKKIPSELMKGLISSWCNDRWLRQHSHEFDVILSCGAVTSLPTTVNVVHFVHSAWMKSPFHTFAMERNIYGVYQWVYSALNSYWEKNAFRQAEVLVAVSETIRREMMAEGIPDEQIRVIGNGVDTQEFEPADAAQKSLIRQQLGFSDRQPLALFVGDFKTNRKNLDSVLKALVQVPQLHLVVVGKAENSPYPQLAQNLGLAERVHFLGYRSDIPKIMQAADFFVFPSRYEPFGMVILEAMAAGLPVITSAIAGASTIVNPDCGIVLKDSENITILAEAMRDLTVDRDRAVQMGQKARAIAEQHSWHSKAECYMDLLESRMGNRL
jgi:glycosyltransferase involved in cell wall biosynthesis